MEGYTRKGYLLFPPDCVNVLFSTPNTTQCSSHVAYSANSGTNPFAGHTLPPQVTHITRGTEEEAPLTLQITTTAVLDWESAE